MTYTSNLVTMACQRLRARAAASAFARLCVCCTSATLGERSYCV